MGGTLRGSAGFSLIELMITLAVLSILLALAVPSFRETILDNRRAAAVNEFVSALNLARSEAVTRRQFVTVCRSASAVADTPTCGTGSGFESGWVVFVKVSGDAKDFEADDILLRQRGALGSGITIRGNNNVVNRLTYSPIGTANTVGTFVFCDSRGAIDESGEVHARQVVVATSGRARTDDVEADRGCQL
jgi:type IV fimbrial biogenesis protein FimT